MPQSRKLPPLVLGLAVLPAPARSGSSGAEKGGGRDRPSCMPLSRKLPLLVLGIVVLLALNHVFEYGMGDFQVNPYYARIIHLIGINITLAVSLNLINGLAGQFSIGHAGFMAVGGYTATYVTVYYGRATAGPFGYSLADAGG